MLSYFAKLKLQKGCTAEFYRNNPDQLTGLGSPDLIGLADEFDVEMGGNCKLAILFIACAFAILLVMLDEIILLSL